MEELAPNLYSWAADIDAQTRLQAERTSRLPIIAGHVALMPDAHLGIGATIGSVVPTEGAVIPSCVGVDIGCGMGLLETELTASDLPDDLTGFLEYLRDAVPAGLGRGHSAARRAADRWLRANPPANPDADFPWQRTAAQLGSLGSGNHFLEVVLDENDTVYLFLHSGSRGIGNRLATGHIKLAKDLAKAAATPLEDPDLAWFAAGTPEFRAYFADLMWAQAYARENREIMLTAALDAFRGFLHRPVREISRVSTHHNYCAEEVHEGRRIFVTRKGAIRAGRGELGLIPGSMGTGSYVVRGLGSAASYESCSHGAGRRMSRTQAKKLYTGEDLARAMVGKTWQEGDANALVDEIPHAYRDVESVMAAQTDLVEVVHTLRQLLNYKGADDRQPPA